MVLKLISVSCLFSCGQHTFNLSVEIMLRSMVRILEVSFLFIPPTAAAFILTVNLSGSRCPVALS